MRKWLIYAIRCCEALGSLQIDIASLPTKLACVRYCKEDSFLITSHNENLQYVIKYTTVWYNYNWLSIDSLLVIGFQYFIQCFCKPFLGVTCQNDTLKFWDDTLSSESLDMVLLCIEAKQFEESMFSCTWPLQQTAAMLQADTISGAEVGSENCKFGICALSCAPLHLRPQLLYCRRFVQYGVRNCESTCNCGSVLLFHRCDRLACRCIRLHWRQKVGSCSAHAKQDGCRVR